eukprot:scaffold4521_cov388-Prasinococcus_capsulatus_cf.AAC.8
MALGVGRPWQVPRAGARTERMYIEAELSTLPAPDGGSSGRVPPSLEAQVPLLIRPRTSVWALSQMQCALPSQPFAARSRIQVAKSESRRSFSTHNGRAVHGVSYRQRACGRWSFSASVKKAATVRTVLARAGPNEPDSGSEAQQLVTTQQNPLATAQGSLQEEDKTDLQKFLFPDKEELPDDMEMSLWVCHSLGAHTVCLLRAAQEAFGPDFTLL